MTFLNHLAKNNLIKEGDIPSLVKSTEMTGKSIDSILLERGLSQDKILEEKGKYFDVPIRIIKKDDVSFDVLRNIPEESASHYKIAPLSVKNGILEVGVVEPEDREARDALMFISAKINKPVKIFLISSESFDLIMKKYKGLDLEVRKALTEIETEIKGSDGVELLNEKTEKKAESEAEKITEEAPVTKIVAVVIRHAVEGNASDVHIEHMGENVRVRFRVDGVLYTSLALPVTVHNAVVARIKILANLKLDEKRKPQGGRFSARIDGRKIDFRVSTFPAYSGEKVVMRILDPDMGKKKITDMGLTKDREQIIRDAIKRSYGLILITGPTGSGKTTTLYSMLGELDKEKKNIVSLEDPVEYSISGVSQSQVRPEIGYTFANGLRSILRQDPDVIMVGEIRDKETAQLAIQAALTGHLVLSTLHTNSAIGAVPRLVDMGVDPYLIAPTLVLAVAQRLVKKLCHDSKKAIEVNESTKIMVSKQFEDLPESFKKDLTKDMDTLYEPVVSEACPGGTSGRIPVFEFLPIDNDIERIILENPTEQAIWASARSKGMITMKEDAIRKAFDGIVSFEEVNSL